LPLYQRAIDSFADSGMLNEQAMTLIAASGCTTLAGRHTDAALMLTLARELAHRSGSRWLKAMAESHQQVARRPDRHVPEKLRNLTNREREIASMAATGKRTREIALDLCLSPRTVDVHLVRIYRKLGIRSRASLAQIIAELG
jgi:DNA-binding NarL/FixJ family response regulator